MTVDDDEIYEDNVGLRIILATHQDLTSSTVTKIKVKKPDLTEVDWVATIATLLEDGTTVTPEDGYLEYTTDNDDLDQAGDYALQAYVEWGSTSKHSGKTFMMEVHEKFK